jgi:hypothetical protein
MQTLVETVNARNLFSQDVHFLCNSLPLIKAGDVEIAPDMVCVSFMTRYTLFLSMVNSYLHLSDVRLLHKTASFNFERWCFLIFEHHLLGFVGRSHKRDKLVWLSSMNDTFINIDDIYLRSVDPDNPGNIREIDKFVYMGGNKGFISKPGWGNDQAYNRPTIRYRCK